MDSSDSSKDSTEGSEENIKSTSNSPIKAEFLILSCDTSFAFIN